MAGRFPEGFLWGAATASYQIEGSPLADRAGPSIWHRFSHTPGNVQEGHTGDVACDHYRRWREDIALMRELGLKAYRFSVAWPRVLPEGTGRVNEAGIMFYERLVDGLLEAGIEPMVTLYHWDLPAALQDRGGWANSEVIGWFTGYARSMFRRLGDRVRLWITLNEPWVTAHLGYATGVHAPGMRDIFAAFRAVHHQLLAHTEVVKAFKAEGKGEIGIAVNLGPQHPASSSDADREAAERWDAYLNRLFLDPLFFGKYPEPVVDRFGWALPEGWEREVEKVKESMDFVGVNYYTRSVLAHDPEDPFLSARSVRQDAPHTDMGWEVYPEGLYEILTWIRDRYWGPRIYITENGAAFPDKLENGRVEDPKRVDYLRKHFLQADQAVGDGVDLRGYMVWSLMDNFEWAFGYTKRFGLVYVDYSTQRRVVKESGRWYACIIEKGEV
ncbi:MAG TPA: beta-glucosidase [Candidatus Latescibacteria bacterium]|nr:beta-glucosidase [Candidatus Latescibacterota bacterium]